MKAFHYDNGDMVLFLDKTEMLQLASWFINYQLDPDPGAWAEYRNTEKQKQGQYGKVPCQILF